MEMGVYDAKRENDRPNLPHKNSKSKERKTRKNELLTRKRTVKRSVKSVLMMHLVIMSSIDVLFVSETSRWRPEVEFRT